MNGGVSKFIGLHHRHLFFCLNPWMGAGNAGRIGLWMPKPTINQEAEAMSLYVAIKVSKHIR